MKRAGQLAIAVALGIFGILMSRPVSAQQVIGYHPQQGPICQGPLGPGPCAAVQQYMMQQQMRQPPAILPPVSQQGGMQQPMGGPNQGLGGLPGAGALPQDGQIVASIYQGCGGEPRCMAAAWAAVEIQRCRNGFGAPGGCFGPNGEIMRVVNRFVPQHLQPNVILRNAASDFRNGPGENNDVVGRNGWLRKRLGI